MKNVSIQGGLKQKTIREARSQLLGNAWRPMTSRRGYTYSLLLFHPATSSAWSRTLDGIFELTQQAGMAYLTSKLSKVFIQATTVIVDTVIVESTALVEQKPLTTQFYLLLVESPL